MRSDVKLPDANGVDLLPRFKAAAPDAEVVLNCRLVEEQLYGR